MREAFIKYQNFGENLINNSFTIYSDKGFAIPSGLNSDELLRGAIINIDDDASKVFVTPSVYDLIASGNNSNPNISGIKFIKTSPTQVFIPGLNNYNLTQRLTGATSSNYEFGTDSLHVNGNGNVLLATSTKTIAVPRTGLYIYTGVSGTNWNLKQTVPQPTGIQYPIGYSSAVNSNGSVIATTSWGLDDSPGYVYIYTGSTGNGWALARTLTGISGGCGFGWDVSMNSIGNIIAVAEKNNNNSTLNRIRVYTGSINAGFWALRSTLTHPDLTSLDQIAVHPSPFGGMIVAGTPNSSGALIFTGASTLGWGFRQKLSGASSDGSSISINNGANTILLGNNGANGTGYVKIFTGNSTVGFQLKQTLSGFNLQSNFGRSVSIKDTTIVVGAHRDITLGDDMGAIYIYTGSTTGRWNLSRSFTGTSSPGIQLGRLVDIYNDTVIASAPKLSGFGAINVYNPTSFTNVETYISEKYQYAIWNNPVMRRWVISDPNSIGSNLTSPTNSFVTDENGSIYSNYNGASIWTGSVRIFSLNQDDGSSGGGLNVGPYINKLHVYNTPGITGFAGTYTSGVFTIGGIQRVGFRNDQNPNFYIYKNNLPSAWRAVENLYNGPFTWYSVTGRQGVDEDPGKFPPVTGWRLGDNSVMNPPPVTDAALPLPEMNFGHCAGNTLLYPIFIYKANSTRRAIDDNHFYSGGLLSSSGTSELFSGTLSDMFPDLYNKYFDKQFFYTNIKNNNRLLLFKSYIVSNSEVIDSWYITESPSSYEGSGYYYWTSQDDYTTGNRNNYYDSARKIFKPYGNNINNLQDISIDTNVLYSNAESPYKKDFNLQNFSGELIIKSSGNSYINDVYKLTKISGGKYNGLTGISGSYYIFASPKFNVSGVTCGNQAFILNPTVGLINQQTGFVRFVRAIEGFQFEVQFTRNLLSGWNTTGVNLVPSSSQSNVPSGFIREEFYLPISQLAGGNLFFRMSGTTATWKILDSQYNYIGMRNCQPNSNILPHNFWFTGDWSSNSTRFANSDTYEIIPVYKHNETISGGILLGLNTNYDYSKVSGVFNLNTGNNFVFQFFNDKPITGTVIYKNSNSQELHGILNFMGSSNVFYANNENGVARIRVENKSKNIRYFIFKSGTTSILNKVPYDTYYRKCKFN